MSFIVPRTPICVFLLGILAQAAIAQSVTVEVTIEGVEAASRGLMVSYQAGSEKKEITLDVSRKAEILLNGNVADLEALGSGLKASVEYHKELAIVTKIEATGETGEPPQLIEVSELERPFAPCISEDGLTIYYEKRRPGQGPAIYTAHRRDADSFFENEKELFDGMQPVVTNDGLEMILVGKTSDQPCFHYSSRDNLDQSFRRPKLIAELRDPPSASWSRNARFSIDGLSLYFTRYRNDKPEIVVTTRADRESQWNEPQVIELAGSNLLPNHPSTPYVTEDGRTLFCVVEGSKDWMLLKGNLMRFKRASASEAFADGEFVQIEGFPKLIGRFPQYVAATKELFFLQSDEGNLGKYRLIIIKNFVP